jgi:predicted nucleic acid-binding protein
MHLIDTNVWYDYFAQTANFEKAEKLIFSHRCSLNQAILIELTNLLQNKESLAISKFAENFILENPKLFTVYATTLSDINQAHIWRKTFADVPLTLTDALILTQCLKYGLTGITLDELLISFGQGSILLAY